MAVTARFTPSVLDGDLLEELFVAREHLVADAVGRIERAARSEERAARLFVGPRGAGKTHLLSLIAHRARSLPGFGTTFQLAWLPEDMWTVDTYDDLIEEIVGALDPMVEDDGGEPVGRLRAAVAERGPIVVLVENLDRVFGDIDEDGQRRLRALIENDRSLLLIATTTRLDDELRGPGFPLSDDDEQPAYFREADWPFYGFFDTYELPPFTLDQATEMLSRIAAASGDAELARTLEGPVIRRRLAAIDRLASGQPRMWALLAAGLSIEGLDELVEALMTRFDDLTPYFQSQMQTLSPQERKVVRALADAPGSLNVGQIAERSGIGDKAAARTITGLRKKGWLRLRTGPIVAKADGRLSYYDLAEPLARLAFQLKESRGQPVRTVVEFLKHWFDPDEFDGRTGNGLVDQYLARAAREIRHDKWMSVSPLLFPSPELPKDDDSLSSYPLTPGGVDLDAMLRDLDDALVEYQADDPSRLISHPASIVAAVEEDLSADPTGSLTRLRLARLAVEFGYTSDWIQRSDSILSKVPADLVDEATQVTIILRCRLRHHDAARTLLGHFHAGHPAPRPWWFAAKLLQSAAPELSFEVALAGIEAVGSGSDLLRLARVAQSALHRLGRSSEVVSLWESVCARMPGGETDLTAWVAANDNLARAYGEAGDITLCVNKLTENLRSLEDHLGADHLEVLGARNNLAGALDAVGQTDRSVEMYEMNLAASQRAFEPGDRRISYAQNNLAVAYCSQGQFLKALPLLQKVFSERSAKLGQLHPEAINSAVNLGGVLTELGRFGAAETHYRDAAEAAEKTLGPMHPATLSALNNLAGAMRMQGDLHEALRIGTQVVSTAVDTLGSSHPETIRFRANLYSAIADHGDAPLALSEYAALLGEVQIVLGDEHPLTLHLRAEVQHLTSELQRTVARSDGGELAFGDDALGAEEGAELADE